VDYAVASLKRLRTAAKAQLLIQRLGLLVAGVLGVALCVGLLDFLVRFPGSVRMVLWAIGAVAVIAVWRRRVHPALRFSPTLTQMALRVEAGKTGRDAKLQGFLASGLELGRADGATAVEAELNRLARAEASERFRDVRNMSGMLAPARLARALALLLAVGVPLLTLTALAPEFARIGTSRVLAPWSGAVWPKRTGVVDASTVLAHPIGTALPMRALLTKSSRAQGKTDVSVYYRLIVDGDQGEAKRALLTPQDRRITVEPVGGAPPVEGELYERLLDTSSLIPARAAGSKDKVFLEYWFETSDDSTQPLRLALVEPPTVKAARVFITPPTYAAEVAAGADAGGPAIVSGELDVGQGRDERAAVGPVLAGSRVVMNLTLSREVPVPPPEDQASHTRNLVNWVAATLPGLENSADLITRLDGTDWILTFTAEQTVRLPVVLRDEYGIGSPEEAAFRFDVVEDRAPAAVVVEPPQDESVLATALLDVAGEGRDDVGLASVVLRSQVAKPPGSSIGAAPEPAGDPTELHRAAAADGEATVLLLRAPALLDLSAAGVTQGDEVWLTTEARDIYAIEGLVHAPVVSSKRRLRIISEGELIEQVRAELAGLRESAKRLEQEQGRLADQTSAAADDSKAAGDLRARQDGLGDRLLPLGGVLERLQARAQRNRLEDESLAGLLNDAQAMVKSAGEESDRAGAALERLGERPPGQSPQQTAQDALEAGAAQETVQEELLQLANLLDRGQDNWAVRRAIEKLLTEQRQLTSQTAAAAQTTQGQSPEQLSPQKAADLERVGQRQEDAAQRAGALVEALQQRSSQMQQADPSQAQAMQTAANRARQEQVKENLQKAGEQIKQNKTGSAGELQKQAERTLQDMLKELDRADEKRDEALRRVLASLIESLTQLIQQQDHELARLGKAMGGAVAEEERLDAGMIALNQNTLGVLASAKESMRDAVALHSLIDSAAAAQSAAVVALRAQPADHPEADENERVSLARLAEAVAEAERLESEAEDRDSARKLDELRQAYREALELQLALNAETIPLLGKELGRRERAVLRGLAARQDGIRQSLSQLRSNTQDLADAKLFDYVHTRLDHATADATAPMREGVVSAAVARNQRDTVRLLEGLLQSLADAKKKDQFRGDNGGGGGGGGGAAGAGSQPLIPPAAELKLLRFMQQEAADQTRSLSEAAGGGDPAEMAGLTRLQRELAEQAQGLLDKIKPPTNPDAPSPAQEPNQ